MQALKRFSLNRDGNIAIIGSLLAVPLVLAVGIGLDYSSLGTTGNSLQQSLDSASLAIAREGTTLSDAEANAIAAEFLKSNFPDIPLTPVVVRSGGSVSVSATIAPNLMFGGMLGKANWEIQRTSVAEYAPAQYEVSLVLDTTGSMAGAKLAAMKDAVNTLVDAMSAQVSTADNLKFAVVPYSTFVNVGPQFGPQYNSKGQQVKAPAKWLDSLGRSPIPQTDLDTNVSRFSLYKHLGKTWPGCVETRLDDGKVAYDVTDAEPDTKKPASLFVPVFGIDEPDTPGAYPNSYLPDGIAGATAPETGDPLADLRARLQRYGAPADFTPPATFIQWLIYILTASWNPVVVNDSPATFYVDDTEDKGPGYRCSSQPIMALTSDADAVKAKVNSLVAAGATNTFEGVMWGWRVLTSGEPFAEGVAKTNKNVRKVMIVLTDGVNWFGNLSIPNNKLGSAYTSFGYLADGRLQDLKVGSTSGQTTAAMNAKTIQGCTNAKADGIEIYAIRLEVNDANTSAMLEQCATDKDHYFNAPSRDQLKPIFDQIRDRMTVVRLAS
ncbi:MAG: VWA domain-containing protein [Notoacmeibacter sp.]|nr:VWA domain-containing protein [Notoacmeibacter sp.]